MRQPEFDSIDAKLRRNKRQIEREAEEENARHLDAVEASLRRARRLQNVRMYDAHPYGKEVAGVIFAVNTKSGQVVAVTSDDDEFSGLSLEGWSRASLREVSDWLSSPYLTHRPIREFDEFPAWFFRRSDEPQGLYYRVRIKMIWCAIWLSTLNFIRGLWDLIMLLAGGLMFIIFLGMLLVGGIYLLGSLSGLLKIGWEHLQR